MNKIIIATRNKGKVKEFKAMLEAEGFSVLSLDDLEKEVPEIKETGSTFQANAQIKAETVASLCQAPVIADDSGLIVDALEGRPGVYSARYAGEYADDKQNYEKVLSELKSYDGKTRSARFVAVLALAIPEKKTIFFEGHCEGEIAEEAKGEFGFGYDPIFIPKGYDVTMAELSEETKNKISHRFHALVQLKRWLAGNK